ncbi:hypothetical protein H696_04422 [Fonticula alba]|uniref:Uncharacterized protein n=1 Tax=Fonticula alba TaxID=691883 RepID=A0A058Z679_FONAL|nr:hypothetical protein H696_04422 [Fonticula alba]KCV69002.1 hypothetical protein H696_04422 [Fonticula alba]|eukprot:XP_009496573.1 hypothetical protein H696_04422 [Fonticula alba]
MSANPAPADAGPQRRRIPIMAKSKTYLERQELLQKYSHLPGFEPMPNEGNLTEKSGLSEERHMLATSAAGQKLTDAELRDLTPAQRQLLHKEYSEAVLARSSILRPKTLSRLHSAAVFGSVGIGVYFVFLADFGQRDHAFVGVRRYVASTVATLLSKPFTLGGVVGHPRGADGQPDGGPAGQPRRTSSNRLPKHPFDRAVMINQAVILSNQAADADPELAKNREVCQYVSRQVLAGAGGPAPVRDQAPSVVASTLANLRPGSTGTSDTGLSLQDLLQMHQAAESGAVAVAASAQ